MASFCRRMMITFSTVSMLITLSPCTGKDINVVRMSKEYEDPDLMVEYGYKFADKSSTGNTVKFGFAKHFQDHMVLQQAPRRANVYGFSFDIGKKVIAMVTTEAKKYYYTTTIEQGPEPDVGRWSFTLDPIKTLLPVKITVASDNGTLTLNDVLFGDVWLCSGQSNMQFTVSQSFNASQEIENAKFYPSIRIMTVTKKTSETPLYDLLSIDENWSLPNKGSVGGPAFTYFSAVCWMYGRRIYESVGYPIGLIATDWGGTPVEAWSSSDALAKCNVTRGGSPDGGQGRDPHMNSGVSGSFFRPLGASTGRRTPKVYGPGSNSVLWNAMVHPLLGMTIYGAIWYQGENDATQAAMRNRYNCTFPAMIADWRSKFNAASAGQTATSFPFGFVQLAPTNPLEPTSVGFPDIRWHQTADVGYVPNSKMPNVFMAVTIDLPDLSSTYGAIHPRDKEDVAERLALSGLAVAYNRRVSFQGPFPVKASVKLGQEILLDYGSQWKLDLKSPDGFEVLCVPPFSTFLIWVPITITNSTSTTITLDLRTCNNNLQALRYAWRIEPCAFKGCAVYSAVNSLPGPPFVVYAKDQQYDGIVLSFS